MFRDFFKTTFMQTVTLLLSFAALAMVLMTEGQLEHLRQVATLCMGR